MKKEVLNTDAFWSAVKRKNMSEILTAAFIAVGEDEVAGIAKETTRMTDAAITRMRSALGAEGSAEDEGTDTEDDHTEEVAAKEAVKEQHEDDFKVTVGDIKLLVGEGSKKSLKAAKKAFKEQFAEDHPNYKELKKLIKKAGK